MIWTYIFEFLVKYVFGGTLNVGGNVQFYYGSLGNIFYNFDHTRYDVSTADVYVELLGYNWPIGNYLAFITTIIIMALIVWFAVWLTIWVFKLVSHAFLLK